MKNYGNIDLAEGSEIINATVSSGLNFPNTANTGELFFKTANPKGLFYYDGDSWEVIASETKLNSAVSLNAGIKQLKEASDKDDDNFTQYLNNERADARYASANHAHPIPQLVTSRIMFATGTTLIPYDNTIPQKTEGTQIASASIVLASTNSKVRISGSIVAESGTAGREMMAALFSSGANAINVVAHYAATANVAYTMYFDFIDSPGVLNPIYTVRFGVHSSATWKVNKSDTSNGAMGGVLSKSNLILQEIF